MYGPEKTILGFCRALAKRGWHCEISLIYRSFAGDPQQHPMGALAQEQGTPYEEMDGRLSRLVGLVTGLRRRMEDEPVDVLHTHDYKADLVGLLATRGMKHRPALVSTPRHSETTLPLVAFQWLDGLLLHRFDRITESSEASIEEFRQNPKLRPRVRLVRHGNEAGRFGKPEALPPRDDGPVVSVVGRLHEVKGHEFFLHAMAKVAESIPAVQVWLAGEGPLEGKLRAICGDLGIAGRVHFLGYRQDVDQILSASAVTVVSSRFETSCRTAMEALHLGCPLVATPVGVIPEMVCDDDAGLLTPYGDVDAMARAVLRVLLEPGLAERLSKRGVERCLTLGSHDDAAAELAAVYVEAIGEHR
jgi:glycosyltransferase involved in cell wall biosynthesis